MDSTDRDIIVRVLGGDRESFHALIERHQTALWSTLRATLRNAEDAREVFQETWLRAYQRLDTLREATRLRSWLLSIALNLTRQRMRRPSPASMEALAASGGEPADERAGAEEHLVGREHAALLRAEIEALPPRQREVVDLRVNHELAHGEIAELLGISAESSRANYYQALRRLRSRFERDEPG